MCSSPGGCEGAPECLDDEGAPLPARPEQPPIRGGIRIDWGRPYVPVVLRQWESLRVGRCFLCGAATFREVGSVDGDRILPFVTRIDIGAPPWGDVYFADVTTWVTEDGKPVGECGTPGDEPAIARGEAVTATFRYILGSGG